MNLQILKKIIKQEMQSAEERIINRIQEIDSELEDVIEKKDEVNIFQTPLPENENYQKTLELLLDGKNQSEIARILGVSVQSIRRYVNWLTRNGHYEGTKNTELTDREERISKLIYDQNKSLTEVASIMQCTIENVKSMHDNLIAKGYLTDPFIKILYPDFLKYLSNPIIGFPTNRYKLAKQVKKGQLVYIYLTTPCKMVVALVRITSNLIIKQDDRWPYVFEVEVVIPPKKGVTLSEVGINRRLRIGDTQICISNQANIDLMNKLSAQPDLTPQEIDEFIKKVDIYLNKNRHHN